MEEDGVLVCSPSFTGHCRVLQGFAGLLELLERRWSAEDGQAVMEDIHRKSNTRKRLTYDRPEEFAAKQVESDSESEEESNMGKLPPNSDDEE
jgi:hypothetical protein